MKRKERELKGRRGGRKREESKGKRKYVRYDVRLPCSFVKVVLGERSRLL